MRYDMSLYPEVSKIINAGVCSGKDLVKISHETMPWTRDCVSGNSSPERGSDVLGCMESSLKLNGDFRESLIQSCHKHGVCMELEE